MECKFKTIGLFKTILDTIAKIADDPISFNCKSSGIGIKVMDPSHVSMVDVFLPKAYFSSYQCKKAVKLGINLGNLNKILKQVDKDDKVSIKLDKKGNKVHFEFEGETLSSFSLNLVDVEEEQYPEYKIVATAKVKLDNASLFAKGLKNSELFSDHASISVSQSECVISSKGDNGETKLFIDGEMEGVTIDCVEGTSCLYPLMYLSSIAKTLPVTEVLTLELSNDMPIFMTFKLKDEEEIYLKFFLAPRVETLEEEEEEELDEEVAETLEELEEEALKEVEEDAESEQLQGEEKA